MSSSTRLSRRRFLRRSATAAGAALAAPYVVPSTALGKGGSLPPSERVTMGFIGIGGQGRGHLLGGAWTYITGGYVARKDVQVLAVCDVWQSRRDEARDRVNEFYSTKYGKEGYKACQAFGDFRELLARDDIDAVLIATPIHWHALMAIMAAEAGKDVYCEKPTAVTVRESRAMAEAVQRYGRVYQAGTQQRSEYGGKFRIACELVRSGRLGQLKEVYACCPGGAFTWQAGFGEPRPLPEGFDWDLWLGPAPWAPYDGAPHAHRFGTPGINWGQHHYDIVQWALDADRTGPVELNWEGDKVSYRYASGVTVYGAGYPGEGVGGSGGACFVGTEGRLAVDREHLVSYPASIVERPLGPDEVRLYRNDGHSSNFLECVRTRKRTICDADTAHRAASVLLLGGLAEQLKRPLKWDPEQEQFTNDDEANRLLSVAMRPPWRL
jgi:predicted dehydrogenase